MDFINKSPELKQCIEQIENGFFSPNAPNTFKDLTNILRYHDRFLLCADFDAYIKCQDEVGRTFLDTPKWTKMALFNIASSGKFSSDRTIAEYAREIWGVEPSMAKLPAPYEGPITDRSNSSEEQKPEPAKK